MAQILSSVVGFAQRKIQNLRGREIVPSEAVIDQMMPPELMEKIFLNVDCSAIVPCALVSKYWCCYATNEQIQEHVVNEYCRQSIDELKIILAKKAPSFDLNKVKWRSYPANYPRKLINGDRMLAAKAGKLFLDVKSISDARQINYALAPQYTGTYSDDVLKFWVKLHGKFKYDPDSDEIEIVELLHGFTQLTLGSSLVQHNPYALVGKECDVIMEFCQVPNQYTDLKGGVLKMRVLGSKPYLLKPK